jgi:DNA mismatch endonuclease Vsr
MSNLTQHQRRKNMRAIKSKGSKIEIMLGKAMWSRGLRYRKNDHSVFGKPDFTFKKYKIAIFCDSEFWHGKDWHIRKHDHKSNIDFWHNKIQKNINRDIKVNKTLTESGWKVIRFWGKEIENDLVNCVAKVERAVYNAKK